MPCQKHLHPPTSPISRSKRETIQPPPSLETRHRGGALSSNKPHPSLARNARRQSSNHLPRSKHDTEGVSFLPTPPLPHSKRDTEGNFALQPAPSPMSLEVQGFFPLPTATTPSLAQNERQRRFLATATPCLAHHPSLVRNMRWVPTTTLCLAHPTPPSLKHKPLAEGLCCPPPPSISPPSATLYTHPGRATRGFKAYDTRYQNFVFLKDSWC